MNALKGARLESGRPGRGRGINVQVHFLEMGEEETKVFVIAKIRCIWRGK